MDALAHQIAITPALRALFEHELDELPRWTMPDELPERAVASHAAVQRELIWLVLALAVDRDARTAFAKLLSSAHEAALDACRARLAPRQVQWVRDVALVRDELVLAPGVLVAPPITLASPPIGDDALAQYLDEPGRTETTTRGLKKARFGAGAYDPRFDAWLGAAHYDLVVIDNPSSSEVDRFDERDGYYLVPSWLRYVTRSLSERELLDAMSSKHRTRMRNMLAKSAAVHPRIGPLLEPEFAEWYALYRDEVLSKPGAIQMYQPDHVATERARGSLALWHAMYFRDPSGGQLIGGAIMADYVERGLFTIAGAAYHHEFRHYDLSVRTFVAALDLAAKLGWPLSCYGSDENFFGYDYALGLLSYKLSVGVVPFPDGTFELIKLLDTTKIATVDRERREGCVFFSVRPNSTLRIRYRAARDAGRAPWGHELLGAHYFEPACLRAEDSLVCNHLFVDPDVSIRTPGSIEVRRRPLV